MIKLKSLLTEGADQVSFEGEWYEYTTNSNRCTFFIYDDVRTGKEQYLDIVHKLHNFSVIVRI